MPNEWLPWLNRGLWAEEQGRRKEALESYGRVLALDPALAGSPFWRQGNRAAWWDDILASGDEVMAELGWGTTSWKWQVLVAAGRLEEAAAELEEWLGTHPHDAQALVGLGEALVGLGRPAEALPWLDRALALAPYRARARLVRGEAKLAVGQLDEAEQDLRMALFLEPEPRGHLGLARLARARGDTPAALREFAQALRPLVLSQNHYVVLYGRMGWPAPLPQVSRIGYRLDEETALEWGAMLEAQGETATARAVYAAALALDPFLETVQQQVERLEGP
jgi:tetratricopeptide (TPR) repeat protein